MSFIGILGITMEGSGFEKALESVYRPNTVTHINSGKAISRALRGISYLMLLWQSSLSHHSFQNQEMLY